MKMTSNRFSWLLCILSVFVVTTSQQVLFKTFTNVVVIGQQVYFVCQAEMFNPTRDHVKITYQDDILLSFANGNFTYYMMGELETYFETDIIYGESDMVVGITFTIKQARKNDAGKYQCVMTVAGEEQISPSIQVEVKTFPEPSCKVIADNDGITYDGDGSNGLLVADEGVNVTLQCNVDRNNSNLVDVSLEWTRSDGELVSETNYGARSSANITVPMTSLADNVTYICTAKNSSYRGFAYTCTIEVFLNSAYSTLEPITTDVDAYDVNITDSAGGAGIPQDVFTGAGAAIGMLIVLLLIVLTVVCISRHNARKRDKRETQPYYSRVPVEHIKRITPYYSARIPAYGETGNMSAVAVDTNETEISTPPVPNGDPYYMQGTTSTDNTTNNTEPVRNHNDHIYEVLETNTLERPRLKITEL